MDEGRNMILLFPTLINFKSPEDRKNFDPRYVGPCQEPDFLYRCLLTVTCCSCHMFYPRRIVDIPDGKPKWSGINNDSELVGDTPEDYKEGHKKRKLESEKKKE